MVVDVMQAIVMLEHVLHSGFHLLATCKTRVQSTLGSAPPRPHGDHLFARRSPFLVTAARYTEASTSGMVTAARYTDASTWVVEALIKSHMRKEFERLSAQLLLHLSIVSNLCLQSGFSFLHSPKSHCAKRLSFCRHNFLFT